MRITNLSHYLITLVLSTSMANAQCLAYEPAKVSLTGRLFVRDDYGPPSYGESPQTDSREQHIYLALDHPVCTQAGNAESDFAPAERDLKLMQLVYFVKTKTFNRAWLEKRVKLTGTLLRAQTAHHWTPVLMLVERTDLMR